MLEYSTGKLCSHPRVGCVDTKAAKRSSTHGEQPLGLQDTQGFAKGGSGNVELLHQNRLGGQVIPLLDVGFDDLLSEVASDQGRRSGAAPAVHASTAGNV